MSPIKVILPARYHDEPQLVEQESIDERETQVRPEQVFQQATGFEPYPYQLRLATGDDLPQLLSVPTGVGKTAAAVLAWVYRRRYADVSIRNKTPRRLVYCLPMRTLVEQTRDSVNGWLKRLEIANDAVTSVDVHLLMGGEDDGRWYEHPERDAILIGTQDMFLSRALNRGYGMSRYRWPVDFSLLHNDCLWVLDETQLMGVGLTTSAQLEGLREKLSNYANSATMWMSATLDDQSLETVDHVRPDSGWLCETITQDDKDHARVSKLITATKPSQSASARLTPDNKKTYAAELAGEVHASHRPGTLTLVVINRVARAQEVFTKLQALCRKQDTSPELALIHSRFRPVDRGPTQTAALDESNLPNAGRIIVATQAIEAGVDISATTLFTELATWSSLVQRFGRCNRRGTCGTSAYPPASVYWIDIDIRDEKKAADLVLPYDVDELKLARKRIGEVDDVGPAALARIESPKIQKTHHVLRRKDLLELFDTTADLSGNDLDVSRYIRDSDDSDVQLYWRDWDLGKSKKNPPPTMEVSCDEAFPPPSRRELCAVPIGAVRGNRGLIKGVADKDHRCYAWNPLDRQWQIVRPNDVRPGMVLLLHSKAGGYDPQLGWTANFKHSPVSDCRQDMTSVQEAMDAEELAGAPCSIEQHLADVGQAAQQLCSLLSDELADIPWSAVIRAAWWHDVGKAHAAFQGAVLASNPELSSTVSWAKSGMQGYLRYQISSPIAHGDANETSVALVIESATQSRRGLRHELASALAWLQQYGHEPYANLIAFLIAAHHGKVRLSIRSMPNEDRPPDPERLFARGIWHGDVLPLISIRNEQSDVSQEIELSLEMMQLGQQGELPSWLSRMTRLVEEFGPFRLAFLETLVRVADWRGSNKGANQ